MREQLQQPPQLLPDALLPRRPGQAGGRPPRSRGASARGAREEDNGSDEHSATQGQHHHGCTLRRQKNRQQRRHDTLQRRRRAQPRKGDTPVPGWRTLDDPEAVCQLRGQQCHDLRRDEHIVDGQVTQGQARKEQACDELRQGGGHEQKLRAQPVRGGADHGAQAKVQERGDEAQKRRQAGELAQCLLARRCIPARAARARVDATVEEGGGHVRKRERHDDHVDRVHEHNGPQLRPTWATARRRLKNK
mmetsp:Transcript_26501/g.74452  ORF Transcript_26501/g.74452 Transcript_26501/m.74452 type:complete len:248 (-) Transcript_26501:146-889(-)